MARELSSVFAPGIVSTNWTDRLTLSRDASLYRLVPREVVRPETLHQLVTLFDYCRRNGRSVTFRAGGTSLSGQAVGNDILVDISRGWDSMDYLAEAGTVTLGPGITGGRVNSRLRSHAVKIGPDPASIAAAMVGGIIANNASGMCCGVRDNAYNTLRGMEILLADGTVINTMLPDSNQKLQAENPLIYAGILELRDAIRADPSLVGRIQKKYAIKNTMGYALNAFLDEEQPANIIARLMVGSEGTLGFIVRAMLATIPDAREKWTCFEVFRNVNEACHAALNWQQQGAAAVELMDDASLRSFAHLENTPDQYRITQSGAAALLVEFHNTAPTSNRAWATTLREREQLWKLRRGLMPTIGASRRSGETMINEDVAVKPERLAALVSDVKGAFHSHGYSEAIVFGHAKDGNIHFVLNQSFASNADLERYDRFMQDIAEIVVGRHDGSLKAEHGTGRNMAPFLEREWGTEAVGIMWKIKNLLDPHSILNPGVLLNTNQRVHLQDIKPVPTIEAEVDSCIECGFCEHVCPTRNTTLTPRQRIVLRRELLLITDPAIRTEVQRSEQYLSVASCAVDSICSWACPVGIDTADLVKRLRTERQIPPMVSIAGFVARYYAPFRTAAGALVRMLVSKPERLAVGRVPITTQANGAVVLLPSCPSAWLKDTSEALRVLAQAAGQELLIPEHSHRLCCGQPFESQGYHAAKQESVTNVIEQLERWMPGTVSVAIADTTTCAASYATALRDHGITVLSATQWLAEYVLPSVTIVPFDVCVGIHPGCGSAKLRERDLLHDVVQRLVTSVVVPEVSECCGMGGVHGIRYPDVPRTALHNLKTDLSVAKVHALISGNSLCSCALEENTGIPTLHILELAAAVITSGRLDLSR